MGTIISQTTNNECSMLGLPNPWLVMLNYLFNKLKIE